MGAVRKGSIRNPFPDFDDYLRKAVEDWVLWRSGREIRRITELTNLPRLRRRTRPRRLHQLRCGDFRQLLRDKMPCRVSPSGPNPTAGHAAPAKADARLDARRNPTSPWSAIFRVLPTTPSRSTGPSAGNRSWPPRSRFDDQPKPLSFRENCCRAMTPLVSACWSQLSNCLTSCSREALERPHRATNSWRIA